MRFQVTAKPGAYVAELAIRHAGSQCIVHARSKLAAADKAAQYTNRLSTKGCFPSDFEVRRA